MAFVNIPPNLQDIFRSITDRIAKLETGPNQAMYTADAAQQSAAQGIVQAQAAYAQGIIAQTQATQALTQAQAAYALGSQALIKDANTITNSNNNLTGINANGITVYSGASQFSGARVVMNSAGIAGYNSSNTATFAINASTGAVSTLGAIFTSSTISGGSLNINGNAVIDTNGFLTATGATITGTITSSNATITGGSLTVGSNFQVTSAGVLTASNANITGTVTASAGTIGGWTLSSTRLFSGAGELNASTGNATLAATTVTSLTSSGLIATTASNSIYSDGTLTSRGSATFGNASGLFEFFASTGNMRVSSVYSNAVSGRTVLVSSTGLFGTSSSSQRFKHNIEDYEINKDALLSLDLKKFNYNEDIDPTQRDEFGFIAEQAEQYGLLELIQYDKDGNVDFFDYARLPVFLFQIIKEQETRIATLEGK